jgi:2-polyprenyl-3-methyl-5-hydroxy-6-metoxy-1,4-benzoquinol methylase
MPERVERKTTQEYWNSVWQPDIRTRVPSKLNVDVLNATRLIAGYIKHGDNYLEIGCAPCKLLAWVAVNRKARVTGLDYSESGIAKCRALFNSLGLTANFHQADLFEPNLPLSSFDVVASFGLVEHFSDPCLVVEKHLDFVKPGGVALMTIPNYGGLYGVVQKWFDAENLALHNLDIMTTARLVKAAELPGIESARAYPFGRLSPWLVNLEEKFPRILARLISVAFNMIGLMQPMTIAAVAPMLVLEVKKA